MGTIPIRVTKKTLGLLPKCKQIFCNKKTLAEAEGLITNTAMLEEIADFYCRTGKLL